MDRGGEGGLPEAPRWDAAYLKVQLLESLHGNYSLAGELAEFDGRFAGVTEEQVRGVLADSE